MCLYKQLFCCQCAHGHCATSSNFLITATEKLPVLAWPTVSVNDTIDDGEESLWQVFTDGSKSEQGVGSVVAVFTGQELMEQLKF
jgi:hypothetical protein